MNSSRNSKKRIKIKNGPTQIFLQNKVQLEKSMIFQSEPHGKEFLKLLKILNSSQEK